MRMAKEILTNLSKRFLEIFKKKPIKVFLRISANADCGVGWYRQFLPLMTAERKGLVKVECRHFTFGKHQNPETKTVLPLSEAEHVGLFEWCDVAYFSRNDTPDYIKWMAMCSDKEGIGKPAILDYDDDVEHTRPVNPGYRSFHPNSEYVKWNKEACKWITGLSVSTNYLKEKYSNRVQHIYVLPNSIDMKERDEVNKLDLSDSKLYNKKEGEFRIIWSGSASHHENLSLILKALKDIMVNHPHVTFYHTGLFGDLFTDFPQEAQKRIFTVPFVDLRKYGRILREMNGDLALAPLTDCNFNRAKSNLRVLEYGSVKYPVIASDVEPYQCFSEDEVVLAKPEEWYFAMEDMIFDDQKRKKLSNNLYKRVKKDFDVNKNCKKWVKMLREQIKLMR